MRWEVGQNYLNKLEGNRKRLINPIGPAGGGLASLKLRPNYLQQTDQKLSKRASPKTKIEEFLFCPCQVENIRKVGWPTSEEQGEQPHQTPTRPKLCLVF